MITPRHVNHEAYAPAPLLTRKLFVSVGAMRGETHWLHRWRLSSEPCFREAKNVTVSDVPLECYPCLDFINLGVNRLDIGEKNAREWCTMCPSPESDQKTATFPSFTKSFFLGVAAWNQFR